VFATFQWELQSFSQLFLTILTFSSAKETEAISDRFAESAERERKVQCNKYTCIRRSNLGQRKSSTRSERIVFHLTGEKTTARVSLTFVNKQNKKSH
jgi:hypothetical protein